MTSSYALEHGTGEPLANIYGSFMGAQSHCDEIKDKWIMIMSHREIQKCVEYVAQELNERFRDETIVLCAILKGAYLFLADLTKRLTIPYSVYFVEASSYGDEQVQSDQVQLLSRLVPSKFHGRKCVIIDELFDHGATMNSIKGHLLNEQALQLTEKDIFTCTLFHKESDTSLPQPDLVGIRDLPQLWLVGYGLDDQGTKRGWCHLFGCPKIDGVPRVPADDAFGYTTSEAAMKAYGTFRKRLCDQMDEIDGKLCAGGCLSVEHVAVASAASDGKRKKA